MTPLHDVLERKISQLEKMLTPQNIGDAEDVTFVLLHLFSLISSIDTHLCWQQFIDSVHDLVSHTTSEQILLVEIETISEALDGDEGEQRPHDFKSASFSIPTTCSHCQVGPRTLLFHGPEFVTSLSQTSIWGLSKLGKTCKLCGVSVHARCELKVGIRCLQARHAKIKSSSLDTGKLQ